MTMLKTSTIFITLFAIILVFVLAFSSGKGIVTLPDYGEAVAFCGNEIEFVIFDASEATAKYDEEHDITYVINKGHEDDVAVIDLMGQAQYECAKLSEED